MSSIYTDGAWCKLKKSITHDVVVLAVHKTGTYLRDLARHIFSPRSFLIGFIDDEGKTVPYGNVSSGWQHVDASLLNLTGRDDKEYDYVEPTVVVEIMAHSLLEQRKFREPRILRTRHDKRPIDCKAPDGQ